MYIEALRNYLGNNIEGNFSHSGLSNPLCQGKRINLTCIAPKESIRTYQKLIRVEKASQAPKTHFQIAQSYLVLAQRENNKQASQRRQEEALSHLGLAARSYDWEVEARLGIAYIRLKQKQYRLALQEVRYLKPLRRQPGFPQNSFSNLARRALTGVGRTKDADCFASIGNNLYGSRQAHCRQLSL